MGRCKANAFGDNLSLKRIRKPILIPGNPAAVEAKIRKVAYMTKDVVPRPETLITPRSNPIADGGTWVSSAKIEDDRFLVVWVDGSSIKQGYALNSNALLTSDGITDITTILTGLSSPTCFLSKLDLGLFLTVCYKEQNGDGYGGSWLYKTPSGNGGDWILHKTISSVYWRNTSLFGSTVGGGIIKIGDHYLGLFMYLSSGIGINTNLGYYTSPDMYSWTLGLHQRGSYGCTVGNSANVAIAPNGDTFTTFSASHAFDGFYVWRSNDDFISHRECILEIPVTYYMDPNFIDDDVPKRTCWLEFDERNNKLLIFVSSNRNVWIKSVDISTHDWATEAVFSDVIPYTGGSEGTTICNLGDNRLLLWSEDDSFEIAAQSVARGVSV